MPAPLHAAQVVEAAAHRVIELCKQRNTPRNEIVVDVDLAVVGVVKIECSNNIEPVKSKKSM